MSRNKRSGRASTALTRTVLEHYGAMCWLQLPGCTRLATTKDHVTPVAQGGDDSLDNLRPACATCNSKRRDLSISGTGGINVTIITGPPAAGKTTYALEHAKRDDVLIDLDRLAAALMPITDDAAHDYPQHIRNIAIGARKAAMDRALRTRHRCNVWIIHAVPTIPQLQQYARLRYRIHTIDPGRAITEQRAAKQRPGHAHNGIALWYDRYPDGPASIERHTSRAPAERISQTAATAAPQEPSRAW